MGEKGAHGPEGEAHDKEHAAALVSILDGFSASLETMTLPFSILLKLALEPEWIIPSTSNPKTEIIKLTVDAALAIPPPMMFPKIMLEIEGIFNSPEGGMPMFPITLPGVGSISMGGVDIAGFDPTAGLAVGLAFGALVKGVVFDIPLGLMGKAIELDPPSPPDFGIPDLIATIPGISAGGAEFMAGCVVDRFNPLKPYAA